MHKNTRFRLAALVICAAAVLAAVVLARGSRGIMSLPYGVRTTEGRQAYLHALGWEIDPATEDVRETSVPETFDAMMQDYNALQREQGFDLTPYRGMPVTVVTYEVTNCPDMENVCVTLWICDNVVIAGDVHSTAMDGFMYGIVKE